MISKEYKEAMSEVLRVLKLCDKDIIEKIPLDVIKGLKQNAINVDCIDVKFEAYPDDLVDIKLSQEAIALLAAIYRKYLCTDEERIAYDSKLLTAQELLGEDGISGDIFKQTKVEKIKENEEYENLPKEIKKENFISRLINKIKRMFIKK